MIMRSWHGAVRAEDAARYHQYLTRTGLKDYRSTPGNLGVRVLRRLEGDVAHFELISAWRDLDALRAFAGDDPERARYYPEDARYLLELEPRVRHHQVVAGPDDAAIATATVARLWRGWTRGAHADAYQRLLLDEVFPGIAARAMPGYLGIHLLRREEPRTANGEPRRTANAVDPAADPGPLHEFVTVMWFDSMASAARFSHDPADPERAVVPPAAQALLERCDHRSRHYEVLPD